MNLQSIQWYSPTSAQWSKPHFIDRDWLCSDPPVTLCGRKPARRHRHILTHAKQVTTVLMHGKAVASPYGLPCNGCRREYERMVAGRSVLVRKAGWLKKVWQWLKQLLSPGS